MQIKTEVRVYGLIIILALVVLFSLLRFDRHIARLEERASTAQFNSRLTAAYVVELYAWAKATGLNPPPLPRELSYDPSGSSEGDSEQRTGREDRGGRQDP